MYPLGTSPTPEVDPNYMFKYLHTEQQFPDNYIEEWFLEGMRVNYHLQVLPLTDVLRESLALSQQISTVVLYITVFMLTGSSTIQLQTVYWADIFLLLLCYVSCVPLKISPQKFCGWRVVILFGSFWGLVPVISTITTGYDPNTIYTISGFLFVIHLTSFDYGYINNYVNEIKGVVAYNAVMVAAVTLSSVLPERAMIFPLISFAIILFVFNPIFRHYLHKRSNIVYILYNAFMFFVTLCFVTLYSKRMALVYLFGILFATFLMPKLWNKLQGFKTEVSGAWDEAVPASD
ncbi:phosphatidylinositol N-acetylglucosaminyltransferase subunit C, putative [Entamoeba invadens IP1]|uniref:phosphatidylinositol N-acetylglucosaminyltransferase subunit C, putative n=1 Tax=Entamoeba invadens IP1 TaxID=370355 RepID=UPI0002C3E43A|nr:phosphatidylinositol N-acetylglucosaminyltransferase subunit C, putative [Entamoeba invadens IP1]ELP93874.1 phosphatidylinositol N-acetylglucosaminyltransferase subunit C, putative [Entamoeba invadens IP1]|eukprot:XP_004260645.1 phosphatidylinositol N-acetylglucosaminyltransferase subunit C, putative [Entamoeba invadens IP1]